MTEDSIRSFSNEQFSQRKSDHIKIALDPRVQAEGMNGLDRVVLQHEALPDLNFSEIDISSSFLTTKLSSPLFISSMTAGHEQGVEINQNLALLSHRRQILMGVGSQRRELNDPTASLEWQKIRALAPQALLLGNIGIAQLIHTPLPQLQRLMDSLQALGLFVHLNPLQECLQPEGTTNFKGGLLALEKAAKALSVPVIVKEVGCGFSQNTLKKLESTGVHAVDVSGFGGTHWGRLEGYRSQQNEPLYKMAETFAYWGISTAQSMKNAIDSGCALDVWASGGVRNGLDAAKLLAMGARKVGLAKPFLQAALAEDPTKELDACLHQMEQELKIAMFCTGVDSIAEFSRKKTWQWVES